MLLHEEAMVVMHPLLRTIRINNKFGRVLKLKPFRDLGFKSQLGTYAYLDNVLNAKYTRLMHSIGVMHLVDKLLDTIQIKYPKDIIIPHEDREILELAALGHDIGHLAFSHSMENKSLKSHEERTLELFKAYANELNSIFGYDITSNVLKVFEYGRDPKKSNISIKERIDILKLCACMLMGNVDCDRMEYLMTDRYMLTGNHIDYSRIFESIAILRINDSHKLAFDNPALPLIEDMLTTRVYQYESVYCTLEDWIIRTLLRHYVYETGWSESDIYFMQEYDILSHMHNVLRNGDKESINYHLARSFLHGNRENLLCKKFTDVKIYDAFRSILYEMTNRREMIETKWLKFKAYSPEKNAVYISSENGKIRDLAQVSSKVKDCETEFGYVIVDIDPSYKLKDKEVQKIRNLF